MHANASIVPVIPVNPIDPDSDVHRDGARVIRSIGEVVVGMSDEQAYLVMEQRLLEVDQCIDRLVRNYPLPRDVEFNQSYTRLNLIRQRISHAHFTLYMKLSMK